MSTFQFEAVANLNFVLTFLPCSLKATTQTLSFSETEKAFHFTPLNALRLIPLSEVVFASVRTRRLGQKSSFHQPFRVKTFT
jgi:hypothetical protein